MILYPNAKINIGLNILNLRNDGHHNIETVMYPLEWCDAIEIIPNDNTIIETQGIELNIENYKNNIVYKAWELLHNEYSIPNVKIVIQKNIPHGAGLGGGSSNAAFTLKGLNEMFNLNLSIETLEEQASKLGSDCAFFIRNKPAFSYGRGELLKPVDIELKGTKIIVVKPPVSISTAEAYKNVVKSKKSNLLNNIKELSYNKWTGKITNAFEKYATHISKDISEIRQTMIDNGAIYVSLSGSGSAVYGIFTNNISLKKHFSEKTNYYYWEENIK